MKFYFDDNNGSRHVLAGLRARGIECLSASEAGNSGLEDEQHLDYATRNGFALVSEDVSDFPVLHWAWLEKGRSHHGIVLNHQGRRAAGDVVRALIAHAQRTDVTNDLTWLRYDDE